MKHNLKILTILLLMFIIAQFIGLFVGFHYSQNPLPYGMQTPEIQNPDEYYSFLPSIIFSFILAIMLLFLLSRIKTEFILKTWFFIVTIIALGISILIFTNQLFFEKFFFGIPILATTISIIFSYLKIFQRNFIFHNLTELLIYPGIATVFIPLLNIWTLVLILILISIYDIWAVWHSGIMQKMAKFQIQKLGIFAGFFVPYLNKNLRTKVKKMSKKDLKKGIKVNIAILGGGDVVFPIIASGVVLRTFGSIPALGVIIGATCGLLYLFLFSEKKKFYPAMPYITAGILLGLGIGIFTRSLF